MTRTDDEHWKRATGMLRQQGPAPVPDDLAERAYRAALQQPVEAERFADVLMPCSLWMAPCLVAAALILMLLPPPRAAAPAAERANPVQSAWDISTRPFDRGSVTAAILATPARAAEVRR